MFEVKIIWTWLNLDPFDIKIKGKNNAWLFILKVRKTFLNNRLLREKCIRVDHKVISIVNAKCPNSGFYSLFTFLDIKFHRFSA